MLKTDTSDRLGNGGMRLVVNLIKAKTRLIAQSVGRKLEGFEIEVSIVQDAGKGRSKTIIIPNSRERGIIKGQDAAQIWTNKKQILNAIANPKSIEPTSQFLQLIDDNTSMLLTIFNVKPELIQEITP